MPLHASHVPHPEYKIPNSPDHTGPFQRGRAEVNLTIIGELWGIIKVHWLQRTPAAGQNRSQDVQPPGRKTGGTSQDLPPLSFLIRRSHLAAARAWNFKSHFITLFSVPFFRPSQPDRPAPFFQLSHICEANEMFCSEKKEGGGREEWEREREGTSQALGEQQKGQCPSASFARVGRAHRKGPGSGPAQHAAPEQAPHWLLLAESDKLQQLPVAAEVRIE